MAKTAKPQSPAKKPAAPMKKERANPAPAPAARQAASSPTACPLADFPRNPESWLQYDLPPALGARLRDILARQVSRAQLLYYLRKDGDWDALREWLSSDRNLFYRKTVKTIYRIISLSGVCFLDLGLEYGNDGRHIVRDPVKLIDALTRQVAHDCSASALITAPADAYASEAMGEKTPALAGPDGAGEETCSLADFVRAVKDIVPEKLSAVTDDDLKRAIDNQHKTKKYKEVVSQDAKGKGDGRLFYARRLLDYACQVWEQKRRQKPWSICIDESEKTMILRKLKGER